AEARPPPPRGSRTFTAVRGSGSEQGVHPEPFVGVRARSWDIALKMTVNRALSPPTIEWRKTCSHATSSSREADGRLRHGCHHDRQPGPQRAARPYLDNSRQVWVAPWHNPTEGWDDLRDGPAALA